MLEHGIAPTTGAYTIDNSLRLNDDDSAYLSRTPASAGNRKKWTYSVWVKGGTSSNAELLGCTSGTNNNTHLWLGFRENLIFFQAYTGAFATTDGRVFRDKSAWYHFTFICDTTEATASNRLKLYINGEQATLTGSFPSLNQDLGINQSSLHQLGGRSSGIYFDGYLAEINFIDGQALSPSDFGETGDYGEWKPIEYTGTYGTNGFYLDFENSGSLGADVSGNSNNWTPNNLAATDQMLDTPTNNFCTLNPLSSTAQFFKEGNLETRSNTSGGNIYSSFAMPSGKWYWEVRAEYYSYPGDNGFWIGIKDHTSGYHHSYYGYGSGMYYWSDTSGSGSDTTPSSGVSPGTVVGFAFDADDGKLYFYNNGTLVKSITTGISSRDWYIHLGDGSGVQYADYQINFGQDSSFAGNKTAQGNADGNGYGDFYYTPPTGYLALCTQNLPDPKVIPSEHFNTVLWTGDGSTTRNITGYGFDPSLIWTKVRSTTGNQYWLDAVRGSNKLLISDGTNAELTPTSFSDGGPYSLITDGFDITSGYANANNINGSGATYVGWGWKANGSGVSNTDGSITSTVSANVDAGFSIVNFTGTGSAGTVGHGLSKTPEMIINKPRDRADNWNVYCEYNGTSDPETDYLILNSTSTPLDNNTIWNDTAPTSSVFTVGTNGGVNASGENFINYCFHSVDGYSKVGSYTGNGSADGTFVYTGFKPAFVMMKATTDGSRWWGMLDDKRRNPSYGMTPYYGLWANGSGAESQIGLETIDTCANGFKYRTHAGDYNDTGDTYIYIAFAEHPFKHSNAG